MGSSLDMKILDVIGFFAQIVMSRPISENSFLYRYFTYNYNNIYLKISIKTSKVTICVCVHTHIHIYLVQGER